MKSSTSLMLRSGLFLLAASVAMSWMAQASTAQSCAYGGGFGGHRGLGVVGGGYGYGAYRGYQGYGTSVGISVYRPYRPIWHTPSHLHYHPGRWMPHGNHFDYIPGHYHLHRRGHWHH